MHASKEAYNSRFQTLKRILNQYFDNQGIMVNFPEWTRHSSCCSRYKRALKPARLPIQWIPGALSHW